MHAIISRKFCDKQAGDLFCIKTLQIVCSLCVYPATHSIKPIGNFHGTACGFDLNQGFQKFLFIGTLGQFMDSLVHPPKSVKTKKRFSRSQSPVFSATNTSLARILQ